MGGHAICLYGYCDTPFKGKDYREGGGYFIFRNSWGESWASNNNDPELRIRKGYGVLPYEYVRLFGIDAVVVEKMKISGKVVSAVYEDENDSPKSGKNSAQKEAKNSKKKTVKKKRKSKSAIVAGGK